MAWSDSNARMIKGTIQVHSLQSAANKIKQTWINLIK
jgi:hypothetical protein